MEASRTAVRLTIALVLLAGAGMLAWSLRDGAPPVPTAVTQRDGSDFPVPRQPGVYNATWDGQPVLVFVVEPAVLDGAAANGTATRAIPLDNGLEAFALSAVSTHLGCTVEFRTVDSAFNQDHDGDGVGDGFVMDPCHLSSWDPYREGRLLDGPGNGPLALLPLEELDGFLLATGFDGHVGP